MIRGRHLKKRMVGVVALSSIVGSSSAFAAGFEKAIPWSGKYAGQGNAAVSSASGPEALFFNPANLAGSMGAEVSANFSPTFSKFSGPVATANTTVDGQQTFSPIFGALASYALSDKLSVAVGSYVGAGSRAEYENAPLPSPFTMQLNPKTELSSIEYAAGVGYQIAPGFKIGGALRYSQVQANLVSAVTSSVGPSVLATELSLSNLKANQFGGYRLGASYSASDWGVGLTYRSAIDFKAEGTASTRSESSGAIGTIINGGSFAASASSTLPAQVALGGHYQINPEWRVATEYVWTNYKKVDRLDLAGGTLTDLQLNFKDQSNIRFGASYVLNPEWTLRGGYVHTTQVTPAELARPTLTAPGGAHSFTLGFTTTMVSKFEISAAAEYSTVSGTGTGNSTAQTKAGDYAASGYVLHTGVNYRF
ncbi:MAG: hypothetical protein RJB38_48 [Pseudomonadota bacterium]|jgi:long-chain fatty acid transport protein